MKLSGINHLAFITDDMEQTIRFYRDLLGLELHSGIGHDGYRHYFFQMGSNQIAFFEYDGALKMERKFHGRKTTLPLGFDHVSFTVDSAEDLFAFKDRLEAAGFEVTGAVDHGVIWSIYFFDNNNIPLEVSWIIVAVTRVPAITEDQPMAIAAEGAAPQPGHWPEVSNPTPRSAFTAHAGNAFDMRDDILAEGRGHLKEDYRRLLAAAGETMPPRETTEAAD